MPDTEKTKDQLILELEAARRQRIDDLEQIEAERKRAVDCCAQGSEGPIKALIRLYRLSEEPIPDILDYALDEIRLLTGSAIAFICFYNESARLLTLHAWSQNVMDICRTEKKPTTYELECTGIWGEAIRQGKPIVVNDMLAPHPLKRGCPEGHVPLHTFLAIPVFQGESIVAVVAVANKQGEYVQKDIDQLELYSQGVWTLVTRKQAEETLKADRELRRFEYIMNEIPIPVVLTSKAGDYEWCNDACLGFLGVQSASMHGKTPYDLFEREYAEQIVKNNRALLEDGGQPLMVELVARGGDRRTVILNKSVYKDSEGEVLGLVGTLTDITERKRAEELIRIRLRLFDFAASHTLAELLQKTVDEACALSNSPIGFYHFVESDQKTLSLQAWSTQTTKHFCKAKGKGLHYSIDQAGVWVDCVHEKRPVIHNDYSALSHRKGLPEGHAAVIRELVVPIMRSDRIVAILGVGNKPVDYDDKDIDAISYLADVAWEITERKRAEARLSDSEERYRMVFDNAPLGIIHFDKTSRITNCNDKFADIIGAPKEQIIGFHLLSQLRDQQYRDAVFAALQGKTGHFQGDYISVCGDKPSRVRALFQRMTTEDGELIGAVGIFEDITERKLAEIEKEKLIGELRDALSKVKLLSGFLPICANCKKIRDDKGYWQQIEAYIRDHSEAEFSHSICPVCAKKLYPEFFKEE